MLRNNNYTTGNLLEYLYRQKYYKLIGIDLSWHTNTTIPQHLGLKWCLHSGKGNITVVAGPATQVPFNDCAPFPKCIRKIDGATIDDAKDLDLAMSMYNLLEYSSNYSDTTVSLWFYSIDEGTDFDAKNNKIKIILNLLSLRLHH